MVDIDTLTEEIASMDSQDTLEKEINNKTYKITTEDSAAKDIVEILYENEEEDWFNIILSEDEQDIYNLNKNKTRIVANDIIQHSER